MIDEPLLVICCFKVPPRRRSAVVSSVFVENWIPNSGEGEKGGKKGREESGGIRESSFIIASGRIKLDGYGKEVNLFTPLGQFHVQLAGKPFSGRVWMLQRIESQVAQGTADFEWLSKHHRPLIKPVKRSDGKEREREGESGKYNILCRVNSKRVMVNIVPWPLPALPLSCNVRCKQRFVQCTRNPNCYRLRER